jgi:Uma2 family endonuclease
MALTELDLAIPHALAEAERVTHEQFEVKDGVLRSKPMASIFHALLLSWLCHLLESLGTEFWVMAEPLSKIDTKNWLRPDIAVVRPEDAEPWKYITPEHWPYLCIEIQSPPDQSTEELFAKCEEYHAQGVPYCWIFDPESRNAWTYHRGEKPRWIRSGEAIMAGELNLDLLGIWRGLKGKKGSKLA